VYNYTPYSVIFSSDHLREQSCIGNTKTRRAQRGEVSFVTGVLIMLIVLRGKHLVIQSEIGAWIECADRLAGQYDQG
jgi:hypothetical protein